MTFAPWDLVARLWDDTQGRFGDSYRRQVIHPWLRSALARDSDGAGPRRVLDAGCGTGATVRWLAGEFAQAQFHGVDSSEQMVLQAQRWERQFPIRGRFDVCDLEKAQPINSGGVQFDSIVCLFTLQDLSNVRAALANLAGCSAEGTLLAVVVEDIGRAAETTRLKTLRAEQHLDVLGHIHENILWEKAPGVRTSTVHRPMGFYMEEAERAGFDVAETPTMLKPEGELDPSIDGYRLKPMFSAVLFERV